MQKEIWIDSSQKNLEDLAIEVEAEGIMGKESKRRLPILTDFYELKITSGEDIQKAREYIGRVSYLIAAPQNWKAIPIENLVQMTQGTNTRLLVRIYSVNDIEKFGGALEQGVRGFVTDIPEVAKEIYSQYRSIKIPLVSAEITDVKAARIGSRICLDFTHRLESGRGALIGTSIAGMVLVDSETTGNQYVDQRAFRVNAGCERNRVLQTPDGSKTPYLSDIKKNSEVLTVDRNGVGKIYNVACALEENRPMVYVEFSYNGIVGWSFLQNAETVKLVGPKRSIGVDELQKGDQVLAYTPQLKVGEGRHLGAPTQEYFLER